MPTPDRPRNLLTPAALHILLALADGPRHGYGIKTDVDERTSGTLTLGPATLYEAIHRMVGDGLIEDADPPNGVQDGRRKFYRLTAAGRRDLEAELSRLEQIVRYARTKRLLPTGRGPS